MTRITTLLAVSALAAFAAGDASAQKKIYKCKNEKGETFYSQAYDPKLCGGGGAQLNDAGVQVRTIERAKTKEELAAEQKLAAQDAEKRKIEAEKKRQDNVLMISYPTEDDLKRSHEQELKAFDGTIRTQELSAAGYEKSLNELLATAAESERAGQQVPPALAQRVDKVRADLEMQRKVIEQKQADRTQLQRDFEVKLARYREIKERQQKQLSGQ